MAAIQPISPLNSISHAYQTSSSFAEFSAKLSITDVAFFGFFFALIVFAILQSRSKENVKDLIQEGRIRGPAGAQKSSGTETKTNGKEKTAEGKTRDDSGATSDSGKPRQRKNAKPPKV